MKVIDIEKIVSDYGNSVFHDDLKRVDSASALEISAIARKLGLNSMYDFDDTGYHLDVSSLVESLNEAVEEEKLETFEDKMNFLAKDEQEAIDGYDKVIALLDAEKDAVVIEQLNKIKVEEEAHKKYLEDVKENHDLVYTEPLEQDSLEEELEAGDCAYHPEKDKYFYLKRTDNPNKFELYTYSDSRGFEIASPRFIDKNSPFYNKLKLATKNANSEFKELHEKVEYIEMPHEVYTKPEDIKRVNDELDKKAREGKLIGIRKEKKMLQLAEPAVNGIWTIYLNDKGFIEKIVVF